MMYGSAFSRYSQVLALQAAASMDIISSYISIQNNVTVLTLTKHLSNGLSQHALSHTPTPYARTTCGHASGQINRSYTTTQPTT